MNESVLNTPLLRVNRLSLDVLIEGKKYSLIKQVSFEVKKGEVVGIVGESGSGKTVTCLSLIKLLHQPPFFYRSGQVLFLGKDLWTLPEIDLRKIRGSKISFIFQEAFNALNPVIKAGTQVAEIFRIHGNLSKKEAREKTLALFRTISIHSPEIRYNSYPHQLSGGLQQRVMIAMALAGNPDLLIADEPTTALDVTIQVEIMEELKKLKRQQNMATIFINHDLGLIAELCDRVIVMYAGEVLEEAPVGELFAHPVHPYTQMLLKSVPRLGKPKGELVEITGQVPSPKEYPAGCIFSPRCPYTDEICFKQPPVRKSASQQHFYKCWHPQTAEPPQLGG